MFLSCECHWASIYIMCSRRFIKKLSGDWLILLELHPSWRFVFSCCFRCSFIWNPLAHSFLVEQVLIRLIGADEHLYSNYVESMQWLEDIDVLEMIVDKFSSSVSCIPYQNDLEYYKHLIFNKARKREERMGEKILWPHSSV